jgi:hypothetical protein
MDTQPSSQQAPAQDTQAPVEAQPNATPDSVPQNAPNTLAPPVDPNTDPSMIQTAQTVQSEMQSELAGTMVKGIFAVELMLVLVLIASMWKVFTKANEAGWKSLIPFYNLWIMLKIARLPGYYLILVFIPLINIFASVRMSHRISNYFGRGTGFTVGMIFLPFIFYPILAFGSSEYHPAE